MRILFVSSEVAPFAKTGGLADVAGSLPRALAAAGHDVYVVMPWYDAVDDRGHEPERLEAKLRFTMGPHSIETGLGRQVLGLVPVHLIDLPELYHRRSIYTDDPDEHLRFAVLGRAALELCRAFRWAPDIVHCHDWQSGLVPLYLRTVYRHDPVFTTTRTVLTIHNLGYQGGFGASGLDDVGLGPYRRLLHQEHLAEGWFGFLETGLLHADSLTTVSPTYAREILTPVHGAGLDDILRGRGADVVGILNGIDTEEWNPSTDPHLAYRYSAKSLWRKEWDKRDLLTGLGLPYATEVPVLGIVSRLVSQKGIGLLPKPLAGILEGGGAQFVALGSGHPDLEAGLTWLAGRFPDQVRFVSGYDERLSHRIEAGIDAFLMPSWYEPCGLNQMYSLAYGTPPIVRRTGGLADTVEHWQPDILTGTGFVFEHFDEGGVWWAINQALRARRDRAGWRKLQLNGMAIDNSWGERAIRYEGLYRRLVAEATA